MLITKNSYGVTSAFRSKSFDLHKIGKASGSSLDRKPSSEEDFLKRQLCKPVFSEQPKKRKERSMSLRTRTKIRRKTLAFSRVSTNLYFLTLTFVNSVEDEQGVKILGRFLEYVSKCLPKHDYLWVAEKQKNGNIHFHVITNKFLKIQKWWPYWIQLQGKYGITPRMGPKPSSAFDVKSIKKNNIKGLSNYITAYVTKGISKLKCQLWNCSKNISRLNIFIYEDQDFLKRIHMLNEAKLFVHELKIYQQDYCTTIIIPMNRHSLRLYSKLDEINRSIWNMQN